MASPSSHQRDDGELGRKRLRDPRVAAPLRGVVDVERRVEVATRLRALGHEFVARDLSDEQLAAMGAAVDDLLTLARAAPPRERRARASVEGFTAPQLGEGRDAGHDIHPDSMVSGLANPMGLGAELWREGDTAVMQVMLGPAFEGAPERSHGGAVAALIDETMGIAMGMQGVLAFTATLDLAFTAPTPINEPVIARAWLDERRGRKLRLRATVTAGDLLVAEASALFIIVDPATFLEAATEG